MSATAASLSCPICTHTGAFDCVQSLSDRLIYVSTNKILCPVCQEEVAGLDKLTIHLFSHVKLLTMKGFTDKEPVSSINNAPKLEKPSTAPQKKSKKGGVKNKVSLTTSGDPIKYVKIYPKLPVISLNTVPIIDISQSPVDECVHLGNSVYVPTTATIKTEATPINTNNTCNVCGLQFIDANILKMHRCLIHNLDETTNQNFTRYHCHICPKNFKMRGSLMVHLRVAHYGFLSGNRNSVSNDDKVVTEDKNPDQMMEDKLISSERSDNKQWQCDVCRKCFTTKYFLKKHKRLHTGETPYACTKCNKSFTFQQSYHKHLLYHNDEKPHTCSYCGRAFKELSTLHNHQRIHTGEKPFSCETCGKSFRQRVSYLVHRRIHTGVMPYKCTACEKSFRYKVSQRTHKCPSKPPGIVIRQTTDLVEKLKKKHPDSVITEDTQPNHTNYPEVSEANAELVRTGAKLSLEDMESENFKLISEPYTDNFKDDSSLSNIACSLEPLTSQPDCTRDILNPNIDDFIDSLPSIDKNVPSPTEIFKKLCLSKEEDYMCILKEQDNDNGFNVFL